MITQYYFFINFKIDNRKQKRKQRFKLEKKIWPRIGQKWPANRLLGWKCHLETIISSLEGHISVNNDLKNLILEILNFMTKNIKIDY